jgi:hypothetical protein
MTVATAPKKKSVPLVPRNKVVLSDEMANYFRYLIKNYPDLDPPNMDDAAEVLEEMSDEELQRACGKPDLRVPLEKELIEIELADSDKCEETRIGCGWLIELLGEGEVD